jgi:putative ABC transport system permease protein
VLGRALRLGTHAFTIVGIAPKEFGGIDTEATDIWLPLEMRGSVLFGPDWRSSRGYISVDIIARFKPGASPQAFDRAASEIYRLRNEKRSVGTNARVVAGDLLLARAPTGDREVNVAVWIAAVSGLVLLIGCGNVAALVLVRGIARSRELAVKAAVGATRGRLAREILIEAVLLGATSSALAMVLVAWGDAALPQLFTPGLWTVTTFDLRLAALTAAVSAIAAILLGALPALQLSSARNLTPGDKLLPHRGHSRTLDALLVCQLALTLPLLIGAGLFTASFENARRQNTGLDLARIVVVTTDLAEFGEPSRNHAAHRELATRLAELPQVEAGALVGSIPLVSGPAYWLEMDDVEFASGILPYANTVDPSYFKVMGIPIVRGRSLVESDNHPGARRVAVVNEAMARAVEKKGSILGRCLYLQGREKGCTEIVGVSRDAWQFAGGNAEPAFVVPIEPFRELASERAVLVRTKDDPKQVIDLLRREARASGPDLPYVDVWPLGDVFESMLRPWKLGTWMFAGFGMPALTISSVGLAGTIAYSVQRRRRELGIRKALGAQSADLWGTVLRRTAAVVLVGVAVGLAGARASGASLKALLFGIEPTEWRVYAIAGTLMLIVAALTAWVPARRAAAIDPSELLRSE